MAGWKSASKAAGPMCPAEFCLAFIKRKRKKEKPFTTCKKHGTECRCLAFLKNKTKNVNSGRCLPTCLSGFCGNFEHTTWVLDTQSTAFATPDMGIAAYKMDFAPR